jgi:hypothetical protein
VPPGSSTICEQTSSLPLCLPLLVRIEDVVGRALDTAKVLRIAVPQSLLLRADEVIKQPQRNGRRARTCACALHGLARCGFERPLSADFWVVLEWQEMAEGRGSQTSACRPGAAVVLQRADARPFRRGYTPLSRHATDRQRRRPGQRAGEPIAEAPRGEAKRF